MTGTSPMSTALRRIAEEDAVGQLVRGDGRMAQLGSEDGALKLDWVEGVGRLLVHPTWLEEVEGEARAIHQRGIRHIIWSGMGGSVMAVRVLTDLGFCRDPEQSVAIYPLDSTDPAALNTVVGCIAAAKGRALPFHPDDIDAAFLATLFSDVMMLAVSMGMTSEEPITHLTWFAELLVRAELPAADHLLVMTLPGSYLDRFAREHHAPALPLQPDGGTGTGGRMSAPTTRVFLLPVALHFTGKPGVLRHVLRHAWVRYDLPLAVKRPEDHPFVRLAAELSDASRDGICRLLLALPREWLALLPWIEQLMEESLGKEGKGVVVFHEQWLNTRAPCYRADGLLRLRVITELYEQVGVTLPRTYFFHQPFLAYTAPIERLATLAASFLGWQLTMALYGYLHDITFAGQPAVENYKARARALRATGDPLAAAQQSASVAHAGALALLCPPAMAVPVFPASFLGLIEEQVGGDDLRYLDLTINGEMPEAWRDFLVRQLHRLGNGRLGVPVKLRRAPAAYHATEQSEVDGPPFFLSLRLLTLQHERCLLGVYDDTFLQAQAAGTWQAMVEAGRRCFLLLVGGTDDEVVAQLQRFVRAE